MRNKYGAKKTIVDGIRFDSKGEAQRYEALKYMLQQGAIHDLELQPKFDFWVNGVKVCYYKADFKYKDNLGNEIVEDFKGMKTPTYNLKKKMFKALYPQYRFKETTRADL